MRRGCSRPRRWVLLEKSVHPITVREVLSHTSGLPFRSGIEVPTLDRLPLADRVRSYAMTPLEFQPGTAYQYSNAGINTAARILEVVAEQPFEEFVEERLLQPRTSKQTPDAVATEYGLGFSTGGNRFGHGGAYATNSFLDRSNGLILIWLVQHAGFPGEGVQAQGAFHRAARQFANPTATP